MITRRARGSPKGALFIKSIEIESQDARSIVFEKIMTTAPNTNIVTKVFGKIPIYQLCYTHFSHKNFFISNKRNNGLLVIIKVY